MERLKRKIRSKKWGIVRRGGGVFKKQEQLPREKGGESAKTRKKGFHEGKVACSWNCKKVRRIGICSKWGGKGLRA